MTETRKQITCELASDRVVPVFGKISSRAESRAPINESRFETCMLNLNLILFRSLVYYIASQNHSLVS
jgi:hypothetical protein